MGRAAKLRRHDQKMRLKRAAKAQKKASYLAMRGTSKKSKKIRKFSKNTGANKHLHLVDNCGNIGCSRCYPQYQRTIWNGHLIINGKAA